MINSRRKIAQFKTGEDNFLFYFMLRKIGNFTPHHPSVSSSSSGSNLMECQEYTEDVCTYHKFRIPTSQHSLTIARPPPPSIAVHRLHRLKQRREHDRTSSNTYNFQFVFNLRVIDIRLTDRIECNVLC